MTGYGEYRQASRGPSLVQPVAEGISSSLTRNSYYIHRAPSVSASTQSWVYSTQQHPPGPPPPLPVPLPSPVQRLRPLPDPHAQKSRPVALHAVNPSEPPYLENDDERLDAITNKEDNIHSTYRKAGSSKFRNPEAPIPNNSVAKKRTVIRGLVKSIRKIPSIMFGYGASKGTRTTTLRRRGTLGTDGEGTPTSLTGVTTRTGNTPPQYVSNPPTPVGGPVPPNPHYYTHQPMEMQMPVSISGSPPPEVVRLDDVRRHHPGFRIMPPSVGIARSQIAHFFPGPTTTANTHLSQSFGSDNPIEPSSSAVNTAERTTVMIYHHDHHDHHSLTPPLPISRQISSNGPVPSRLSYVGSEQIVRPTSFHGGPQAPPPIDIPEPITRITTPSSHLSYVSEVRSLPSTAPLHIRRSPSQQRSNESQRLSQSSQPTQQHQPPPPQRQPSPTPLIVESSEPIQSPISAHPQPTTDYRKMALSPSHSLRHHTTALSNHATSVVNPSSATSFSQEPSLSSELSPIERFFKTLYHMPWVAYERITVDYLPGKVRRVHGHALGRRVNDMGARDEVKKRRGGDMRKREANDARERGRDNRRRKERSTGGRGRGEGDGKSMSWYKAVLSRSRRTSAEIDLLGSDLGSHSSPTTTTSLGAAIGLGLENLPIDAASPRLASMSAAATAAKVGKSAERERERKKNKQERTSGGGGHHHHQDSHSHRRGRQRRRTGLLGSPDKPDIDGGGDTESLKQTPSPLIPAVYPLYYPPYPYTYPYTAFTVPPPALPIVSTHSHPQPQSQYLPSPPNDQARSSENSRGPRNRSNHKQSQQPPQPLLYGPHPGYTAPPHAHTYQPMIAPPPTTVMGPPVYLIPSTSHGQLRAQTQMQTAPSSLPNFTENENAVGVDIDSGDQQALAD